MERVDPVRDDGNRRHPERVAMGGTRVVRGEVRQLMKEGR
jgi:hypothetical protein